MSRVPAPLTSALAAVVVGLVTGVLGTVAHAATLAAGPVRLPVGLVVATGLVLAADVALRAGGGRLAAVCSGVARLLLVVAVSAAPGPGGDVLVTGSMTGQAWLLLAAAVPSVVAAWPDLAAARRDLAA